MPTRATTRKSEPDRSHCRQNLFEGWVDCLVALILNVVFVGLIVGLKAWWSTLRERNDAAFWSTGGCRLIFGLPGRGSERLCHHFPPIVERITMITPCARQTTQLGTEGDVRRCSKLRRGAKFLRKSAPNFRDAEFFPFQHRHNMTHAQACRPCAKRKVRCDKSLPCNHCKRRPTDRCIYSTDSRPSVRVRQLEHRASSSPGGAVASPARSNDPMMLEEDGNVQYVESYVATFEPCISCVYLLDTPNAKRIHGE
jgi:hypothetical protein